MNVNTQKEKTMRIPSDTNAHELARMLHGDAIPTDAPREHLHGALLQLCEIVADQEGQIKRQEARIERLSRHVSANTVNWRNP